METSIFLAKLSAFQGAKIEISGSVQGFNLAIPTLLAKTIESGLIILNEVLGKHVAFHWPNVSTVAV